MGMGQLFAPLSQSAQQQPMLPQASVVTALLYLWVYRGRTNTADKISSVGITENMCTQKGMHTEASIQRVGGH